MPVRRKTDAAESVRQHAQQHARPVRPPRTEPRLRTRAAITEYWCVFDVEVPTQHPRLHDAIQMARDNDINVAISNPCFELWLILHHTDHTRPINNQQARSILRKHDSSPRKGLDSKLYMEPRKDAVDRARRLTERHNSAGQTFPNDNPSSGVYRLIEAVEDSRG